MNFKILCLVIVMVFEDVLTLENRCDKLERDILILKENNENERAIDENRFASLHTMIKVQQQHVDQLETTVKALSDNKQKRIVFGETGPAGIAFSAYLDHDIEGAGNKQPIVFNKPTFNDGNHYSVNTGVFRCPVDGVYLFIYFIGNRNAREVDAELVVNGVKQNEAVAEGVQSLHDTQGGNSAIVKLVIGDEVWIETTYGSHVEGQWRFSAFTGALLYPTQ